MKFYVACIVAGFALSLILVILVAGCGQPDVNGPTLTAVCNQDVGTTAAGGSGTTTTVGGINVAGPVCPKDSGNTTTPTPVIITP